MLFLHHVLGSLLFSSFFYVLTGRGGLPFIFFFSLGNLVDLDHYNGRFWEMVGAACAFSMDNPTFQSALSNGAHRGILHNPLLAATVLTLFLLAPSFQYRSYGVYFSLGWLLHIACDVVYSAFFENHP